MMNDLFKDMINVCVVVYLDDIMIYSQTWLEHITQVREVLQRLQQNDLFCKLVIRLQQHLHMHPKDLKNTWWYSDQNPSILSTNTSKTIDINNRHIKNIDPKIWNIDETFPISPISSLLRS
jgi:hypothetical protein